MSDDGPWEIDLERHDIVDLVSIRRSTANDIWRWTVNPNRWCDLCKRVMKDGIGHRHSCPMIELEHVLGKRKDNG